MKTGTNSIQVHENWHKSTCTPALFKYWCFLVKVIKRRTGEDTEKTVHCTQCTKSYTKQFQLNHHIKKVFIKKVFIKKVFIQKVFIEKVFIKKVFIKMVFIIKVFIKKVFIKKVFIKKVFIKKVFIKKVFIKKVFIFLCRR